MVGGVSSRLVLSGFGFVCSGFGLGCVFELPFCFVLFCFVSLRFWFSSLFLPTWFFCSVRFVFEIIVLFEIQSCSSLFKFKVSRDGRS